MNEFLPVCLTPVNDFDKISGFWIPQGFKLTQDWCTGCKDTKNTHAVTFGEIDFLFLPD